MKQTDKRVIKTKKLIQEGLIELMHQKNFKEITVKELCDHININRGTFYTHYLDIYDLIEKIEEELYQEFIQTYEKYENSELKKEATPLFIDIFEFVANNVDITITLLGENGDSSFVERFTELIEERLLESINTYCNKEYHHRYHKFFTSYIVYGCIGVVKNWIDSGRKETPEEMATILDKIVFDGARSIS